MYVADQYAERSFYELFGFERVYEGDEFPGFLAIGNGGDHRAAASVTRTACLHAGSPLAVRARYGRSGDEIIARCRAHGPEHEVVTERGGDRFLRRLVAVKSPSGVTVWFEGANEAGNAGP
jgi:hypothetical protein